MNAYERRARELMLSPADTLAYLALNRYADAHSECPGCGVRIDRYESTRVNHARLCKQLPDALNPLTVAERQHIERARRDRSPAGWAALEVRACRCTQRFKVEHPAQEVCRDCMTDDGVGFSFYPSMVDDHVTRAQGLADSLRACTGAEAVTVHDGDVIATSPDYDTRDREALDAMRDETPLKDLDGGYYHERPTVDDEAAYAQQQADELRQKKTRAPRVRVETTDYEFAHGKSPRGFGSWAFAPVRHISADDTRIVWFRGTYADAKRAAVDVARTKGYDQLWVLS